MRRDIASFAGAVLIVFVATLLSGTTAWGQLNAGSITGIVQDPSGAVVPGASVTLTDTLTNFQYHATTDRSGRYLFPSLAPSTYSLTVEAKGFETARIVGITLAVNQNVAEDVGLKVGTIAEQIEVSVEGAPQLQTEDASTGQTIDQKTIESLPLVGRNVFDLAYLAPGVSQAIGKTYAADNGYANNFVSEGARNAQSDVLIDGVSTTNTEQNTGFVLPLYQPSPDAVQEFKIQQTNFSAEYGFTGGTVTNVVMRSGTNNFHGSLYEYWRNDVLNANDFFDNEHGHARPAYRWNDFGGTVGGPILKDKLFFFFDYEGNRNVTYQSGTFGMPTAAERTGDFSELCTAAGGSFNGAGQCSAASGQLWDPYAIDNTQSNHVSTAFIPFNNLATYASPNNNGVAWITPGVAGNLINPVSQKILQYLPLPNIPGAPLTANFFGVGGQTGSGNKLDAKTDFRITDKDLAFFRVSHYWTSSLNGANLLGTIFDANTQGTGKNDVWQGSLNYSHTFSPKTTLTASIGYTHFWTHTLGIDPTFNPTSIGLPANLTTSGFNAPPAISLDGYSGENGNANFGGQPWSGLLYAQDVGQFIASVSHSTGNHELIYGGDIRLHRTNFTQYGLPAGRWEFQDAGTAENSNSPGVTGGDSMASFLVGWATGWNAYEVPPSPATQNFMYAAFVQDNWHVSKRLTLNLGFRYDVDVPRTERHNKMSYFDPNAPLPFTNVSASAACPACGNLHGSMEYVGNGNPSSPFNTYFGGVGPRVGFAYRVLDNTVIRGGFGIYYDPSKGEAGGTGSGAAGFSGYDAQTSWGATASDGRTPANTGVLGQNPAPGLPSGNSLGPAVNLGSTVSGAPIRTFASLPREYSWSFGIQRELPWKVLVDAEYVGRAGQNLYFGGDTYYLDHLPPAVAQAMRAAGPTNNPWLAYVPMPSDLQAAIEAATPAWSNAAWAGTWPMYNGYLPYPQYLYGPWGDSGLQNTDPPIASSIYHGFELRIEKRFSEGLQFLFTYTDQKSIDNASLAGSNVWINGIAGATLASVQDPNNLSLERSLSQFDISQIFQASVVYQLPFGHGKTWGASASKLVDTFLGGWQVSGIYRWDTGQPLLLSLNAGVSLPTYGAQRPDLNCALARASNWTSAASLGGGDYFANDATCLSRPLPFYDGTAPRVMPNIRAPGTNNMSMALFKNFNLGFREGMMLQFRAEAFNLFNYVQFAAPNTTYGTASFGEITSQANQPRTMQLSLRFSF